MDESREQLAAVAKENVEQAIGELVKILNEYEPIELVSRVATYILGANPEEPKDIGGPIKSETNLEYLLSLVTALPLPSGRKFPIPDIIQRFLELLTAIHVAAGNYYSFRRKVGSDLNPIGEIAESLRMSKLHVRGDGYWPHLRLTIGDLLRPHDKKLSELLGFDSDQYLKFLERSEIELQERLNSEADELIEPLKSLYRPWVIKPMAPPDKQFDSEGWARFVEENADEVAAAKSKFDRFGTPELYIFSPQSEAEENILSAFSCEIGSNSKFHGHKAEHAFWPLTPTLTDSKPVIHRDGKFFSFHMSKLQRDAFQLIGDLSRTRDPIYWEKSFLKARDKYLEKETARLFRTALPSATVLEAVHYPLASTGKTTEADIVVVCDDVLIVVECKAGRLDEASKRGGEKTVKTDLKATVAGGLKQAERFVTELSNRGRMEIRPEEQDPVTLDVVEFQRVFKVNVTLDLISSATSELWKLEEAGLTGNTEKSWSVCLNDLRVIVEILNQPALFLHFMVRRLDINVRRTVAAHDELDYLMNYVTQGLFFREGNSPKTGKEITIGGFTEELDQYYRKVQGISPNGTKPEVRMGRKTKELLARLEILFPRHWTSFCLSLLELDIPDREKLLGKLPEQLRQLRQPTDFPFAPTQRVAEVSVYLHQKLRRKWKSLFWGVAPSAAKMKA